MLYLIVYNGTDDDKFLSLEVLNDGIQYRRFLRKTERRSVCRPSTRWSDYLVWSWGHDGCEWCRTGLYGEPWERPKSRSGRDDDDVGDRTLMESTVIIVAIGIIANNGGSLVELCSFSSNGL